MDGATNELVSAGYGRVSVLAGCIREAEAGARAAYEAWEAEMHFTQGGRRTMRMSRKPDAWFDDWAPTPHQVPNDITDRELAVLREAFVAEAQLLLETYDGPRWGEPVD